MRTKEVCEKMVLGITAQVLRLHKLAAVPELQFKQQTYVHCIALIQNSPLLSNLSARPGFSLVAFLFKKPGPPADFEKVKEGRYLKEKDKDTRFTRLKPVLVLRLISKGIFYIRATLHSLTTVRP